MLSCEKDKIKNEKVLFFKRLIKNPKALGAVMPSSKALANMVAKHVDVTADSFVVEVGAGTGSLTRSLLESGISSNQLIVIELDEQLTSYLREQFPNVTVLQGDALNLVDLLPSHVIGKVATIISGIPLINLNKSDQKLLFESFRAVMNSCGKIIQFTYGFVSPFSHKKMGLSGVRLGIVMRNIPPATVWAYSFASTFATTRSNLKFGGGRYVAKARATWSDVRKTITRDR